MTGVRSGDQRIPPLAEADWTDQTRALLESSWVPGVPASIFRTTMARHERLFEVWQPFGQRLITGELPARDREILVLRTAFRARGEFEWAYHEPIARRAGLGDEEIRAIAEGPSASCWSPLDQALLQAADDLLERAEISEAAWEHLASQYDERALIEVVMVVGQYLQNAFLTNSLKIGAPAHLPRIPARPGTQMSRSSGG